MVFGRISSVVCRGGSVFRGGSRNAAPSGPRSSETTRAPTGVGLRGVGKRAPPAPVTDDPKLYHVPGSDQGFTMKQLKDTGNPADWFPNDHPPMPAIVAHRRSPGVNPWIGSCGLCHYPNGKGRPENAGIAGLPEGYILEQLSDFKNGARKTADPGKKNTATMSGNAAGITDEEAKQAAVYFSSMKMTPWIKVVETETVPKVRNVGGFLFLRKARRRNPSVDASWKCLWIPRQLRCFAIRAPDGLPMSRWEA